MTYSNSILETLKKAWNMFKVNNKTRERLCTVFFVNFWYFLRLSYCFRCWLWTEHNSVFKWQTTSITYRIARIARVSEQLRIYVWNKKICEILLSFSAEWSTFYAIYIELLELESKVHTVLLNFSFLVFFSFCEIQLPSYLFICQN